MNNYEETLRSLVARLQDDINWLENCINAERDKNSNTPESAEFLDKMSNVGSILEFIVLEIEE